MPRSNGLTSSSIVLEAVGNIPPAEAEDQHYAATDIIDMAA
jgi:hypothetical protein